MRKVDAAGGKRPKSIRQAPPVYPPEMSRAGLTGAVSIAFIIDKEGNIQNPYVLESNNPWFERPAIDAILKWKFEPGQMNGQPVNVRVRQLIEFNLDNKDRPGGIWRITKGSDFKKLPKEFQWDTPPVPIHTTYPVYPFDQLRRGTRGSARVTYVIGLDGRVKQAAVQAASSPEFGYAALAALDAWRFTPAKKNDGTPLYAGMSVSYDFQPDGTDDVPLTQRARDILLDSERTPPRVAVPEELDLPLKPISRRPPIYPSGLNEAGQAGSARIEWFIDKKGDAQLPRIISSTAPEFGYAAVQAVSTWRFEVPKKSGKPVVVRAAIDIDFAPAK